MSLFTDSLAILAVLCFNVALSEWLVRTTVARHFGTGLLVIVVTALASNLGIIPSSAAEAPVYDGIFTYLAPLAIFMLLLQVNLKDVRRAGGPMIGAFLIGAAGTTAGVLAAMQVVDGPASFGDLYRGLGGMFAGTYIGGGVNFNALALHYGVAKQGVLYAGATAADNILTALWMVVGIALPRLMVRFAGARAPARTAADPGAEEDAEQAHHFDVAVLLGLGALSVWASNRLAQALAAVGFDVPSVIVLSTLALALAQIPAIARLRGSRILGMFSIYVFLSVIGAFCDLSALGSIGQLGLTLLAFGGIVILVHGIVIYAACALLRFDWELVSVASQANVGGTGSALALARSLGRGDLVLPGVLVGSLGYALGTYCGYIVADFLL